ncbi:MAG: cyclic pyranopterin monophosphate synthase MoaC [Gemmatimonadota bacterium]
MDRTFRLLRGSVTTVSQPLRHFDDSGRARMVDVGEKAETRRVAVAEGVLITSSDTLDRLAQGRSPKGDPLQVAQIAGIQAAKRTPDLIPLCHPLPLDAVDLVVKADAGVPGIRARATIRLSGRTGAEMEALTAVSVALLTAYDMLKAFDRGMRLADVRLVHKRGGRSGSWDEDVPTAPRSGPDTPRDEESSTDRKAKA